MTICKSLSIFEIMQNQHESRTNTYEFAALALLESLLEFHYGKLGLGFLWNLTLPWFAEAYDGQAIVDLSPLKVDNLNLRPHYAAGS